MSDPVNLVDPTGEFLVSGSALAAYVYGPAIIATVHQNAYAINKAGIYVLNAITPGPSNALSAILQVGPENINRGIVQSFEAAGNYMIYLADYLAREFPHDAINFTDDALYALTKTVAQAWGSNQPPTSENQSKLYWTAGKPCE